MKRVIELLIIGLSVASVSAEVLRVELPAHSRWCRVIKVDVKQMIDPRHYEETLREGIEPFEACARAKGLRAIGIPWVTATTIDAAVSPPSAEITLCAVVPAAAEPCAEQVSAQAVEPATFLASVCREDLAEQCRAEIRTALQGEPWNLDAAAIQKLPWRIAHALGAEVTADNVIAALTSTQAHVLRNVEQTATAQAPVRTPFVAVAVSVRGGR